jgi:hypothetical protein
MQVNLCGSGEERNFSTVRWMCISLFYVRGR